MNYNNAVFETSAGTGAGLIKSDLPEICFSGHSNVGKSSLINKVMGRKSMARTSNKPGKTATVNFFRCDGVRFADLPGYGFAKVSFSEKERWAELMESYFGTGRDIRHVFQLVDARHRPSQDDIDMLRFLQDNGFAFTVVLTKIDKLNKLERQENLLMLKKEMSFLEDAEYIIFSSVTGEGAEEIRNIIDGIGKGTE